MISAVAEMYGIHPQTLRLYEREGLLKPSRTEGNTRLYTDEDLQRLEFILSLARDLGVNISGMAIILQMRERMEEMQRQIQEFVQYIQQEVLTRATAAADPSKGAIVPVRRPMVAPMARKETLRSHSSTNLVLTVNPCHPEKQALALRETVEAATKLLGRSVQHVPTSPRTKFITRNREASSLSSTPRPAAYDVKSLTDCTMLPFKLIYSDAYYLPIGEHVFPAEKYRRIHDRLISTGVATARRFPRASARHRSGHPPGPQTRVRAEAEDRHSQPARRIGNGNSLLPRLADAFWLAAGGSILAGRQPDRQSLR